MISILTFLLFIIKKNKKKIYGNLIIKINNIRNSAKIFSVIKIETLKLLIKISRLIKK